MALVNLFKARMPTTCQALNSEVWIETASSNAISVLLLDALSIDYTQYPLLRAMYVCKSIEFISTDGSNYNTQHFWVNLDTINSFHNQLVASKHWIGLESGVDGWLNNVDLKHTFRLLAMFSIMLSVICCPTVKSLSWRHKRKEGSCSKWENKYRFWDYFRNTTVVRTSQNRVYGIRRVFGGLQLGYQISVDPMSVLFVERNESVVFIFIVILIVDSFEV